MKYPNTQRTVSGTVDVFPDDVVLNCDTSGGAVTINLAEIPYNASSGQGFWSTQYKLYINDISNNAGTNNITVVAGTGQTLNNQPTLVLNTNGASCYIMISGNTEYSMFYAPAQNLPADFITVTYAELSALITANNLVPNADYLVTDALFGSTPAIPTNIYIKALTTNKVSLTGQGYFYNADYENAGNYSGVTGFTAQLGIWNQLLVTPVGTVVIWDNFHYVNITGLNIASNPKTDAVNWQLLPLSATKGYIVDISLISYNVTQNRITSRTDKFNSFVEYYVVSGRNSLNYYKWGSLDTKQNVISKNSILYNCNAVTGAVNSFFGNNLVASEVIIGDGILQGGNVTSWTINTIESSKIEIPLNGGQFKNNHISLANISGSNTGEIINNVVNKSDLLNFTNTNLITNNTFDNLRFFVITSNTGTINRNKCVYGQFVINVSNGGVIENNVFENSTVTIETNAISGNIIHNKSTENSSFSLQTNQGDVLYNTVDSQSQFRVVTNNLGCGVYYFTDLNSSRLELGLVQKTIGVASKVAGTIISNASELRIDNYNPNAPSIFSNVLTNGSIVGIQNCNTTSTFKGNTLDKCSFFTTDLNGKEVSSNTFSNVSFGGTFPNLAVPINIIGRVAIQGNSTVEFELDCSDPLVYDVLNQKLNIDSRIKEIGGAFKLLNAGGITIAKIGGLNKGWISKFYNNGGITTFQGVAIGVALAEQIVSSSGAVAFNITTHATGYDSMYLIESETLTVVRETNILV